MISLDALDPQISKEVALEYIEYRQAMEKKYRIKTQGTFDRQMKIALRAHEVSMTPDQLIMFTIDQSWVGINISYTKKRLRQMSDAEKETVFVKTKDVPISQCLTDRSWVN